MNKPTDSKEFKLIDILLRKIEVDFIHPYGAIINKTCLYTFEFQYMFNFDKDSTFLTVFANIKITNKTQKLKNAVFEFEYALFFEPKLKKVKRTDINKFCENNIFKLIWPSTVNDLNLFLNKSNYKTIPLASLEIDNIKNNHTFEISLENVV